MMITGTCSLETMNRGSDRPSRIRPSELEEGALEHDCERRHRTVPEVESDGVRRVRMVVEEVVGRFDGLPKAAVTVGVSSQLPSSLSAVVLTTKLALA